MHHLADGPKGKEGNSGAFFSSSRVPSLVIESKLPPLVD